jgi:hypothetical protein
MKTFEKPEFDDSALDETHLLAKQFIVGTMQRLPAESVWTAHGKFVGYLFTIHG